MRRNHGFWAGGTCFCLAALALALAAPASIAGNFYAGTSPTNVPWPGGVIPYEFTNMLSAAQTNTYLQGLREWELAAGVRFVPHTNQTRWILFGYNTNDFDLVTAGYSPQVVTVNNLSRAQVCHEMGHSFGFTHENIRPDQTNYLIVLTNNITNELTNIIWFTIDPTSVTNGNYDFESVMHLGWDFDSVGPGVLATQQPRPAYSPRYQFRMGNLCLSPGDRAALKFLYGPPAIPLTNVVTTTADVGPGSLRAAIYYVTDNPGTSVRFNIPTSDSGYSNGVFTIHLTGQLPPLAANGGMIIDGSTQPGFLGKPLIFVDGSQILPDPRNSITGLLFYSANNQVKNIAFQGFNWNGLTLQYTDATNNTIAGCWSGLDYSGTNPAPNALQGVLIFDGASRNFIGGTNTAACNVLSGNTQYGVWVSGSNTFGNVIAGSYIGTDPGGTLAVPNLFGGIILSNLTSGNIIGGTNSAWRNVISGNVSAGIWIIGGGTDSNTVQGNFIGLNAAGTGALSNTFVGMYVVGSAQSNSVLGNVISGNFQEGLRLADPGTTANIVQGNFVGTDASGSNAVPNGLIGVNIYNGATGNLIGGTDASDRNILSGNLSEGVRISTAGANGNVIQGNFIGIDVSGHNVLPNQFAGVDIFGSASSNVIGGATAGAQNLISGNYTYGLVINDAGTTANVVEGNLIGTDLTGTNALGYTFGSVAVGNGASGNAIGEPGAGNVIAFSGTAGVVVTGTNSTGNSIRGNAIFSNAALGIDLNDDGVTTNHLGGAIPGPNDLQNYPVIMTAVGRGANTIVSGTLNSTANRAFWIDVYRNLAADPSGYGQGKFHVGTTGVTTDSGGDAVFSLTAAGNFSGQYFSATATDQTSGDTSEFSADDLATNVPAPPAFTAPFSLTSTGFVANISLTLGQGYHVQASTNLGAHPILWVNLTNFTASATNFIFLDRSATGFSHRFYQVISP